MTVEGEGVGAQGQAGTWRELCLAGAWPWGTRTWVTDTAAPGNVAWLYRPQGVDRSALETWTDIVLALRGHEGAVAPTLAMEQRSALWAVEAAPAGISLLELLRYTRGGSGTLPLDMALFLALQVIDAMIEAREVLRRPLGCLTPDRVVLTFHGRVMLRDLGGAYLDLQDLRSAAPWCYVAPEVAEGDEPDEKADIFVFGILLWELLTSRPLISGSNRLAVLDELQNTEIVAPGTLRDTPDAALDRLVLRALNRDRRQRFTTLAEVRKGLVSLSDRLEQTFARPQLIVELETHFADDAELWDDLGARLHAGQPIDDHVPVALELVCSGERYGGADTMMRRADLRAAALRGAKAEPAGDGAFAFDFDDSEFDAAFDATRTQENAALTPDVLEKASRSRSPSRPTPIVLSEDGELIEPEQPLFQLDDDALTKPSRPEDDDAIIEAALEATPRSTTGSFAAFDPAKEGDADATGVTTPAPTHTPAAAPAGAASAPAPAPAAGGAPAARSGIPVVPLLVGVILVLLILAAILVASGR